MKFATASVIESLRINPELCNFLLNDISNNTNGSNNLSLMSEQPQQSSNYISGNIYSALILEESEKLYNKLITKLTNEAMAAAAAAIKESSSLPLPVTNNRKNDTYNIEEPRYNNQS